MLLGNPAKYIEIQYLPVDKSLQVDKW